MLTYIESWQGFNLVNLSSSLKDFKLAMADHCIKIFDCRLSYKFDKAKKEKRFLFPKKPSEPNPRECQQFILFLQEFVCWISLYRVLNLGLVFEPAKSKNLWKSAKSTWKCKLFGLSSLCVLKNAQQLLKFFRAERVIYEGNVRIISYQIMMRWF